MRKPRVARGHRVSSVAGSDAVWLPRSASLRLEPFCPLGSVVAVSIKANNHTRAEQAKPQTNVLDSSDYYNYRRSVAHELLESVDLAAHTLPACIVMEFAQSLSRTSTPSLTWRTVIHTCTFFAARSRKIRSTANVGHSTALLYLKGVFGHGCEHCEHKHHCRCHVALECQLFLGCFLDSRMARRCKHVPLGKGLSLLQQRGNVLHEFLSHNLSSKSDFHRGT